GGQASVDELTPTPQPLFGDEQQPAQQPEQQPRPQQPPQPPLPGPNNNSPLDLQPGLPSPQGSSAATPTVWPASLAAGSPSGRATLRQPLPPDRMLRRVAAGYHLT